MRIRLAVIVIPLLAVTACTGSHPRATSTSATSTPASSAPSSSSAVTPAPLTPVTTPTPTAATTTSSAATAGDTCQTQNLRLSFAGFNGAGGTAYSAGYLTNVGTTTCTMIGYPGLAGLDASGNIVQHAATRNSGMPIEEGKSVGLVTLAPGARAVFGITNTDTVPNSFCPTEFPIAQTQVYPPNQTTAIRVPASAGDGICELTVGFVEADP